jgi:hypothetical protein
MRPSEQIQSHRFEDEIVRPISRLLAKYRISSSVTYSPPSDNSSLRLDLEESSHVGRLTIWQDESYYSEALRVSDGVSLLSRRGSVNDSHAIATLVEELAQFVTGGPVRGTF